MVLFSASSYYQFLEYGVFTWKGVTLQRLYPSPCALGFNDQDVWSRGSSRIGCSRMLMLRITPVLGELLLPSSKPYGITYPVGDKLAAPEPLCLGA